MKKRPRAKKVPAKSHRNGCPQLDSGEAALCLCDVPWASLAKPRASPQMEGDTAPVRDADKGPDGKQDAPDLSSLASSEHVKSEADEGDQHRNPKQEVHGDMVRSAGDLEKGNR